MFFMRCKLDLNIRMSQPPSIDEMCDLGHTAVYKYATANVSAKKAPLHESSWFSGSNEYKGRPTGACAPTCQGAKEFNRKGSPLGYPKRRRNPSSSICFQRSIDYVTRGILRGCLSKDGRFMVHFACFVHAKVNRILQKSVLWHLGRFLRKPYFEMKFVDA